MKKSKQPRYDDRNYQPFSPQQSFQYPDMMQQPMGMPPQMGMPQGPMYQQGYGMPQQGPQFPMQQLPGQGTPFGPDETGYGLDARLDRIEREIVEINRRLNNLTRRVRRMEGVLNIRDND